MCLLYDGNSRRLAESGFMEKPGIEPATPGLQGIALIHYTTGGGGGGGLCFGRVKETSQGDVSFTHPKHRLYYYRKLLKHIKNYSSYSLNPVCPKLISN